MTLYNLTNDYMNLLELAEDPDIDEQAFMDTLEGIEGALEDKAEGYAKVIRTLEGDAAACDAEGKVLAASSDCVEVAFTFDMNGISTLDTAKEVLSKKEQGDAYGMVAYGGAQKEWYEQAAAFDAACVGKTADEILALAAEDGTPSDDVQSAGCTINVAGFVKAASKN